MAETKHNITKGYNFNFVYDAAKLYWAATWIQLNPSTDEKNKLLDEFIIRRLRNDADNVMKQAMSGLELEYRLPSEELQIGQLLVEGADKK